jgi:hypothetical protein
MSEDVSESARSVAVEQLTEFGLSTSTLACDGGGGPRQHAGGPGAPGGFGPRGN